MRSPASARHDSERPKQNAGSSDFHVQNGSFHSENDQRKNSTDDRKKEAEPEFEDFDAYDAAVFTLPVKQKSTIEANG